MPNTNYQTIHQMGQAINNVVRQATGRDAVQNIDMDFVTVAFSKKKSPLRVTVTPLIAEADPGETVRFTADVTNAEGPISYQWQYTEHDGATWKSTVVPGSKTAQIRFIAEDYRLPNKYRCTVQAGGETAVSEAVYFVRPR